MKGIIDNNTDGKLFCPECKSTDISTRFVLPKVEKEKPISMDDWLNEPQFTIVNAVMIYNKEIATCKKCGYKQERWR